MASGDGANTLLVIGQADAKNARRHLAASDGLQQQHTWNKRYLGESIQALSILICTLLLVCVWSLGASPLITYCVTGAMIVLLAICVLRHYKKRRWLTQQREQQLTALRQGQRNSGFTTPTDDTA